MSDSGRTIGEPRFSAEELMAAIEAEAIRTPPPLRFRYRNHRGEEADRTVRPIRIRFGKCEFHPGPQWLLDAFCLDKGAERTFAFSMIVGQSEAFAQEVFDRQRLLLFGAIKEHHAQRGDDRCWMDDEKLYAAAGLPACDRRVGDKDAMLANCRRFVEQRCEGGGPWKSYAELEAEKNRLEAKVQELEALCAKLDAQAQRAVDVLAATNGRLERIFKSPAEAKA